MEKYAHLSWRRRIAGAVRLYNVTRCSVLPGLFNSVRLGYVRAGGVRVSNEPPRVIFALNGGGHVAPGQRKFTPTRASAMAGAGKTH